MKPLKYSQISEQPFHKKDAGEPRNGMFYSSRSSCRALVHIGCISKSGSIKIGWTKQVVPDTKQVVPNTLEHVHTESPQPYDSERLKRHDGTHPDTVRVRLQEKVHATNINEDARWYPSEPPTALEKLYVAQHVRDPPPNDATMLKRFCHAIGVVKNHMGICSKHILDKHGWSVLKQYIELLVSTCSFHDCHCLSLLFDNPCSKQRPNNQLGNHAKHTISQETCRFIHLNVRVVWFLKVSA